MYQTSRQAYHLIRESRAVWTHSSEFHRIPLETGRSLESTSPTTLYRLSLRAISICRSFAADCIEPKHTLKVGQWGDVSRFSSDVYPHHIARDVHIIPGNQWVVVSARGSRPALQRVDVTRGPYFPLGDATSGCAGRRCVASQVDEQGSGVILALLYSSSLTHSHSDLYIVFPP